MDRRRFLVDAGASLLGGMVAESGIGQAAAAMTAEGGARRNRTVPELAGEKSAGGTYRTLGTETLAAFLNAIRSKLPEGRDAANARLKPAHNILAYCGATIWRDKYSLGIAGGHGDSHDDGHYAQNLSTGAWEMLLPPSAVASAKAVVDSHGEWMPDRPASQHSYNHLVTVGDDILQGVGYAIGNAAGGAAQAHRWNGQKNAWERYGGSGAVRPVPYAVLHDKLRARVLRIPLEMWRSVETIPDSDPAASWVTIGIPWGPPIGIGASIGYHPDVDCLLLVDQQGAPGNAWIMDPDRIEAGWHPVAVRGATVPRFANGGLEYVPPMKAFVSANVAEANVLYYLAPTGTRLDPWVWTKEVFSGSFDAARWEVNPGVPNAPWNRLRWSSLLNGIVILKSALNPTEIFTPRAVAVAETHADASPKPEVSLHSQGIVLDDSGSGVSRDYYHYALKIPWRGSFLGEKLGATTIHGAGRFSIPLAALPECLVLKNLGLWANVRSRESGTAPRAEVVFEDGSRDSLACVADATIDPSASAPQGTQERLVLGSAILRFPVPAKRIRSATLVGEVIASGGTTAIEVHAFVSPILPEPPVQYGLRRRGLSGSALLHATDFGAQKWWYPWFTRSSAKPLAAHLPMVTKDLDTGQPLGRTAYCVQVPAAGTSPPPIGAPPGLPESPAFVFPDNLGRELEEVYFQYRLRFGMGWRGGSTQSGKLPGIASDTTVAGNGGGASDGHNGWSFRGLFVGERFAPDSPYNANNGVIPIGWYTYNPDQLDEHQIYGLHIPWTGRGALGLLNVGEDYWIDQYVKVNTPGRRDGIVRAWINGRLAYERTDHVMRGLPPYAVSGGLGIHKIWMTFLHGGDILPLPTKTLRTYWSDWTIASEYIGPP